MASSQTFVVVGGGLAGAKAVEALREAGHDGPLVLVAREPDLPYERPPLSKEYLRGESDRAKATVHPADFYAEQGIELLNGVEAVGLDPGSHRVTLSDGRDLEYGRLLLATGAVPRRPPIPGAELDGVHVLRTFTDADRIRGEVRQHGSLTLVGAGWIGCEVAASARQLGAEVTLVDQVEAPLQTALGAGVGGAFAELHRSHGVDVRMGSGIERLEGDGRVERVVLADGTTLPASTVVIGVGVRPETTLAETGGLEVTRDGIVVDDHFRTSAPDVFAVGDAATVYHPRYGRHVRVEHWSAALNQGPAAARAMLDQGEPYERLPYFFSDQYDWGMEYVGLHGPDDRLVVRGDLTESAFQVLWLDGDGRATAGMHVNDWDATAKLRELVEAGEPVDPAVAG